MQPDHPEYAGPEIEGMGCQAEESAEEIALDLTKKAEALLKEIRQITDRMITPPTDEINGAVDALSDLAGALG